MPASLKIGKYTLYNEETMDIVLTQQMAICNIIDHENHISEHYIGIMSIIKLDGSHLGAPNILKFLNKYLQEVSGSLKNGRLLLQGYHKR